MHCEKKPMGKIRDQKAGGCILMQAKIQRPGFLSWRTKFRWQRGEGAIGWSMMCNAWGRCKIL